MIRFAFVNKPRPSIELQSLQRPPIPLGEIEAGRAADKSFDNSDVLERSRIASSSTSRMPYIETQGRYNKQWYVDIVTLPHNSVRRILSHLFTTTSAVQRLALDMTPNDFAKLFAFVSQVHLYIRILFEAEEKILYPVVDRKLRKLSSYSPEHPLHPNKRRLTKQRVEDLLSKINTSNNVLAPTKETAALIQNKVDKFASTILDYYVHKERALPKLIATSVIGSRLRAKLEHKLIQFFAQLGDEFYYTALLIAPLRSDEVRQEFIKTHFPGEKKKVSFQSSVRDVEDVFFGVTAAFERAASKYESRFSIGEFLSIYGTEVDVGEELGLFPIDLEAMETFQVAENREYEFLSE